MLVFHILAGCIVLFCGLVALISAKGKKLHKYAGSGFAAAMVLVSLTSCYLEVQLGDFPIVGLLSGYFVVTSWITITRREKRVGYFDIVALLLITSISILFYKWGWDIAFNGKPLEGTMPLPMYFVLASIAAFAAAMDLKVIIQGGIMGAQRIARHLWRICIAYVMAMMSFLAQDIFPDAIASSGALWLPVLLLVLLIFYWGIRVSFFQRKKIYSIV